ELHARTGVSPVTVVERTSVVAKPETIDLNQMHLAVKCKEFIVHGSGPGSIVDELLHHDSGSDLPIMPLARPVVVAGCKPTSAGVDQLLEVQRRFIANDADPARSMRRLHYESPRQVRK